MKTIMIIVEGNQKKTRISISLLSGESISIDASVNGSVWISIKQFINKHRDEQIDKYMNDSQDYNNVLYDFYYKPHHHFTLVLDNQLLFYEDCLNNKIQFYDNCIITCILHSNISNFYIKRDRQFIQLDYQNKRTYEV